MPRPLKRFLNTGTVGVVAITLACDTCGTTRNVQRHFLQWGDEHAWLIELCPKHATELQDAVERLLKDARPTSPRSARAAVRQTTDQAPYAAAAGVDLAEVRAWALKRGIPVSGRGRISADVIDRYKKAHRIPR